MANKKQRINKLTNIIKSRNGSSIKDLAKELSVSEMTIRRDIKILEENNIIEVFHGSVVYNPSPTNPTATNDEYKLEENLGLMYKQKDLIGRLAAGLVKKDDMIIIDTGTTTDKLSYHLDANKECTALVFSSNNFFNLTKKEKVKILLAGGLFHKESMMFESQESLRMIENIRANKVFLSAAGLHKDLGITCANTYELATKKTIIKNSMEVILLIDSSKFGQVKSVHFADLRDIDTIITDENLDSKWKDYLETMDINLVIAKRT
ncbi:MAG: DeoR/GlpR family DNA-binding transcription regulator [Anaerococcus sp.]|nr:DeoR/GlpR family DNA-binding transcription regulator [Anaerococcus sp.]